MKIPRLLFALLLLVPSLFVSAHAAQPATMRLDYYHTGNATTETFSFERVVIEPLPWPGNLAKTIDDSNLGNYLFEVRDAASDKLLYSRGFGSIFSEWSDTDEAKKLNRTFSESLRFPAPDAPVKIVLKERREGKMSTSTKSGLPRSIPKTSSSIAPGRHRRDRYWPCKRRASRRPKSIC